MNFLWPAAWGLAALTVPVVIFYLVRTQLERRQVSSFLFWEGIPPQVYNQSLWRKLRRWLSLLLQLLFLLFLVMALARPLWKGEMEAAMREVIILDASASMMAQDTASQQATRWDAARQLARQRIAGMRAFDTALLIEAGASPRVLHGWSRNRRALLRALDEAKPSLVPADLPVALALAQQLRKEKESTTVLISDEVWQERPLELEGIQTLRIGSGKPSNGGITLFSARRSPAAPGEYQLLAQVEQTLDAQPLTLELRRNGQLFDVQAIPAAPSWEKSWGGTGTDKVHFEARLRRSDEKPDDLPTDDHAAVTIPALEPVTVELVSQPHSFLSAVLEALPMVNVIHVWPVESLLEEPPLPRTLTIFHECAPPKDLNREAMVVIAPAATGFWGSYEGPMESPMVSDFDRDSSALRFVSLDQLRLNAAGSYQPAAGAINYAESFGKPLIFGRWEAGAPRWLTLAFGLDSSDLVLRAAFPILMGNLAESLQTAEVAGVNRAPLPGATVTRLASLPLNEERATEQTPLRGGWKSWPLWWWATLAGALWLVLEWGLFSRRITE